MKTTGNTVLITGGATGIGLELARTFLQKNNQVIICGRRKEKLNAASKQYPDLHIMTCDISADKKREELINRVVTQFPKLNILINNAGIQREIDFKEGAKSLYSNGDNEIDINFEAPVHLSALIIPQLLREKESAIINISSGLSFTPIARMPLYCATKAALHSFSLSLRRQLRDTPIRVFEIIPPTVDTELDKGARARRGQTDRGIPASDVASAAMKGIAADEFEITIGQANFLKESSRTDPEGLFQRLNSH
jgi:uncharacterized oxidoreductase